jgi:hypothetical protein
MAVTSETSTISYACDGEQSIFPFSFAVLSEDDLDVVLEEVSGAKTTLTLGDDYTVERSGASWADGGNVVTSLAYGCSYTLHIIRERDFTQETDLSYKSAFPSQTVENSLDHAVMLLQQLKRALDRTIQFERFSTFTGLTLPTPQAGRFMRWKEDLSGLDNVNLEGRLPGLAFARVATTENIFLWGPQEVDGVSVVPGDVVLVHNQALASQNGVYVVSNNAWVRSDEANSWTKLVLLFVLVSQGTAYCDTGWVCSIADDGIIDTSDVTFIQVAHNLMLTTLESGFSASAGGKTLVVDEDRSVSEMRRYNESIASGFDGPYCMMTAGESLSAKDICFMYEDGKLYKANASSMYTLPGLWIAAANMAGNESGQFILPGSFVYNAAWSWVHREGYSNMLYVDSAIPGGLIQSVPPSPARAQAVGHVISEHVMFFFPSSNMAELLYYLYYDGNGEDSGEPVTQYTRHSAGESAGIQGQGTLEKEYHWWNGWNTEPDGSGDLYLPEETLEMPSYDVTLYSLWVPTIFFLSVPEPPSEEVTSTSVIAESPVSEGPIELSVLSLPSVAVETMLRYPDWVKYDGHFNTGGDVPTDDGYYGAGDTVTAEGPGTLVKSGYSFGHWNTKTDGSGTVVAVLGEYTINEATTFYAMWYGDIVVTYLGNNSTSGDPPTDANVYTEDDTVTVLGENTLARSAYEFAGWDTIPDGSGTHYDEDDTFTIGDLPVYLYAQWAFLGSQWVAWGFNPFDPLYDASSDVLSNQLFATDD